MALPLIIIFCDDLNTGDIWELVLKNHRCTVQTYSSTIRISQTLGDLHPDIVVVDVTFRETNGIQICTTIRRLVKCPILLLTPINNESHQLEAYKAGVEDCVIKPISPSLFLAKIKAWLRCVPSRTYEPDEGQPGAVTSLTLGNRSVFLEDGRKIHLSQLEYQVLALLMSHPGEFFTRDEIIERVWGIYSDGDSVKNVIYRIRKKIEQDPANPKILLSSHGMGYTLTK